VSQRAEVDAEALYYFITQLKSFNNDLVNNWNRLKSRWQASSDTWRDIKKDQFSSSVGTAGWDDVIRMMEGYLSTSEEYSNWLQNLHDRATDYLGV